MTPDNIVPCPYEDCDGCVDSDDGGDDDCCHCRRPVAWVGRTPHVLMARCAACGTDVREVDSWGDGDIGDGLLPSFCSQECYARGEAHP
jgi:hypothetical protein